jgi:DNA-binding transcriptional LysR family regulator
MHKENWDDLRFLLAVADNGSVSAAARVLGVNHATVLRRIAAFEGRHGGQVFARTPQGYTVPLERQGLIEAARNVEAAIYSVERSIEGAQAPLSGAVRVTSTDTLCHGLLPQMLVGLRSETVDLQVELVCSNVHLDLARLDADIAIRPAAELQSGLVGEIGAELGFAAYGEDQRPWLGLSGALARSKPGTWLAETVHEKAYAGRADSFLTLREMVAAGIGKAILPCVVGDPDRRLSRIDNAIPEMRVGLWIACHPDMVDVPRIRAVRRHVASEMAGRREALLGQR